MSYKYPVSKPYLRGNELAYLNEALNSGWISSQGKYIKIFEEEWAKHNEMKHGVACSSGTAALTLALKALGIKEGDEVIVPEFTMIACPWAVTYTGATPIFVDCKDDLNMDPDLLEKKITAKTKAIMAVNIYGRRCDMEKIMEIAYEYNLKVVEDSAEAHGIKPIGDIVCFSLYANKIISCGEGGVCLTNDENLANQMKHLRSMAFNKDHSFLHKKIAYNFRMTNMQAAIAKAQLEKIDEILHKRMRIENYYDAGLRNILGVQLMPKRDVVWFYDILVEEREELRKFLEENGIETRVFFKPMSQQPMYYDEKWTSLNAAKFAAKGIYLPTYTDLSESDQEYIINKIKEFYEMKKRNF